MAVTYGQIEGGVGIITGPLENQIRIQPVSIWIWMGFGRQHIAMKHFYQSVSNPMVSCKLKKCDLGG